MNTFLGIDIGTQGTKAALYQENGVCLAEAFHPSRHICPEPGALEEEPEEQLAAVLGVIKDVLTQSQVDPRSVAGLAIAGQMAGVIGIGSDGLAITPYDSWLDTRCAGYIEHMREVAGRRILLKTGNAPSFNHGPKILWWKNERPQIFDRIKAFVQPGGYVALRLCGLGAADAFIDSTYLHFSGFADNQAQRWDTELCHMFRIDSAVLPRIVRSRERVGAVTKNMAELCGLVPGTPVAAGCGDTAASFLSCGASRPGICIDVSGTASVFAATTTEFLPDVKSETLGCGRSVIEGLWHPYAYINGGGQNLEWFRSTACAARSSFDELGAEAADSSNDAHLPMFVPHMSGRVSPAWPKLRGAWVGLTRETATASMFRSILDGVALEYALYQRCILKLMPEFAIKEVRVTGGGERSSIWNQLKADRLQARVVGIARSGGAPMGAALLAAQAVGCTQDIAAMAAGWIELGKTFEPDLSQATMSQRRIQRYASLLQSLQAWTESE